MDTRFLEVCIDGDVEDVVQLLEEMARAGETLGPEILNCVDSSGRVSSSREDIELAFCTAMGDFQEIPSSISVTPTAHI